MGSQGFPHGQNLAYTLIPYCQTFLLSLKDPNLNEIQQFLKFLGGHKVAKILYIGLPINRIMHFYDPQQMLKTVKLIKIGVFWVWKNLWGYGRKVHAKLWPWGNPWDPIYDHFGVLCQISFS